MLAVMPVGDVTCKQHEEHLWKKLGQSRVAQSHRRVGALVNFPADGDLLHLPSENQDHVPGEVATKGRKPPDSVGVVLGHGSRGCKSGIEKLNKSLRLALFSKHRDDLALHESISGESLIKHRVTGRT